MVIPRKKEHIWSSKMTQAQIQTNWNNNTKTLPNIKIHNDYGRWDGMTVWGPSFPLLTKALPSKGQTIKNVKYCSLLEVNHLPLAFAWLYTDIHGENISLSLWPFPLSMSACRISSSIPRYFYFASSSMHIAKIAGNVSLSCVYVHSPCLWWLVILRPTYKLPLLM